MKIQKKTREQTSLEKRNTALLTFSLFGVIPLLLSFFLGLSFGMTQTANTKNYQARIDRLDHQLDSIQRGQRNFQSRISGLDVALLSGDSLVRAFLKEAQALGREVQAIEDEAEFPLWERRMETLFDKFKYDIDTLGDFQDLRQQPRLASILERNKYLMNEIAIPKKQELITKQLRKKENIGLQITSDLQATIDELEENLRVCQDEKGQLMAEKSQSQSQVGDTENVNQDLEARVVELQEAHASVKTNVLAEIDAIRTDIFPDLEGGRIFGNRNRISELKELLVNSVNKIEREVSDLN